MAKDRALSTDHQLALAYAPSRYRPAFTTLILLDARLSQITLQTREPQLALIKLMWWREQLVLSANANAAADPLLRACHTLMCDHDAIADTLPLLVDAWAMVLGSESPVNRTIADFATMRSQGLFASAGLVCRVADPDAAHAAGTLWALADAAMTLPSAEHRNEAHAAIRRIDDVTVHRRLPRTLRPFALLTAFALSDVVAFDQGKPLATPPRRALQALRFAMFG